MVSMNIFSVEFIFRRVLKISRKVFDFKVNPASSVKWESPRCCRRSIRGHGHVAPPAGGGGGGHHAAARVAAHARHVRARADADRVPPARAGCRGVGRCRRPVEAKRWWRIKMIKKILGADSWSDRPASAGVASTGITAWHVPGWGVELCCTWCTWFPINMFCQNNDAQSYISIQQTGPWHMLRFFVKISWICRQPNKERTNTCPEELNSGLWPKNAPHSSPQAKASPSEQQLSFEKHLLSFVFSLSPAFVETSLQLTEQNPLRSLKVSFLA